MCKLAVIFNRGDEQFIDLVRTQYDSLKDQKDGCGGLVVTNDGEEHVFKSLDDYDSVFDAIDNLLPNAKLVVMHTRIATVGKKTIENIHLFDNPNYWFAHNGHVSKWSNWGKPTTYYSGWYSKDKKDKVATDKDKRLLQLETIFDKCHSCYYMRDQYCDNHKKLGDEYKGLVLGSYGYDDEGIELPGQLALPPSTEKKEEKPSKVVQGDMSDSQMFIATMPKNATVSVIEDKIESDSFTGFGFMMDKKTKNIFLLVKKPIYATFTEGMAMFTSYKPTYEYTQPVAGEVMGVQVMIEKQEISLPLDNYPVSWGVYKVKGYK